LNMHRHNTNLIFETLLQSYLKMLWYFIKS
jgi:hypothetical protein